MSKMPSPEVWEGLVDDDDDLIWSDDDEDQDDDSKDDDSWGNETPDYDEDPE